MTNVAPSYEQIINDPSTPPGMLVDIGGYRLHMLALGEGAPTVVLESGGLGWSLDWRHVTPEVAEFTRLCAYDRAGLGWSDPAPQPRNALQMVKELQFLLERADLRPPFVLVGASFGGHVIRLFTHFFPGDVTGMVLVDARHHELASRLPPAWRRQEQKAAFAHKAMSALSRSGVLNLVAKFASERAVPENIQDLPEHVKALYLRPAYLATILAEHEAMAESDQQIRATNSLGDLPLIVIRHGIPDLFSKLPADQAEQAEHTWQELQADLAGLSTNSQLLVAENSGHNIALEQPELIVRAIHQMIEAIRASSA